VGPNGSGKSNIAEAFRFVLGEQRMTQMRSKRTEDLIWNGSQSISRAHNASVALSFDNRKKIFDIDFDDVVLQRSIHRDASTEYRLNDSAVRLKDIIELLSGAHIGSSGHHIISQGETDRILLVNAWERKVMIEDALGLKIYQYKKQESERKLEKTQQHKKEVESLRREIEPHIKFLKTQVDKVEKTKSLREELSELYSFYLFSEENRIKTREETNKRNLIPLNEKLKVVSKELTKAKETLSRLEGADEKTEELLSLEKKLSTVRKSKEASAREVGRLEGELRGLKVVSESQNNTVPSQKLISFKNGIEERLAKIEGSEDLSFVKQIVSEARLYINTFLKSVINKEAQADSVYGRTQEQKIMKEKELESMSKHENELMLLYKKLKEEIEQDQHSGREAERKVFTLSAEEHTLRTDISDIEKDDAICRRDRDDLDEERREGLILVGDGLKRTPPENYKGFVSEEKRTEMRKRLERIKIRLEDTGMGSGEDVLREYEEVKNRDSFLEHELIDLEESLTKLGNLIKELDDRLNILFNEGIQLINERFQELFSITFGGGSASLELVKDKNQNESDEDIMDEFEDGKDREGIEISVSLPRKKIRGLHMLSGGERALTSIALLFAMSQVNPPPFLLLDETDAALDEANSHRYGDMIEKLSKESQLILITHNRETMSRAGVLYGVTMGRDGVSQLLSVGFEDAVRVAK